MAETAVWPVFYGWSLRDLGLLPPEEGERASRWEGPSQGGGGDFPTGPSGRRASPVSKEVPFSKS